LLISYLFAATTIPNETLLQYYTQRAGGTGAGLIFTEGVLITPQGTEWPHAAGIYNDEHAEKWKEIVDAVHAKGTPIVAQLWHLGRVSHPDMEEQKKAGVPVYGPSAVAARGGKVSQHISFKSQLLMVEFSSVNYQDNPGISHLKLYQIHKLRSISL